MSYDDNNLKSRNSQMYFDSLYRDKRQRHTPKNHPKFQNRPSKNMNKGESQLFIQRRKQKQMTLGPLSSTLESTISTKRQNEEENSQLSSEKITIKTKKLLQPTDEDMKFLFDIFYKNNQHHQSNKYNNNYNLRTSTKTNYNKRLFANESSDSINKYYNYNKYDFNSIKKYLIKIQKKYNFNGNLMIYNRRFQNKLKSSDLMDFYTLQKLQDLIARYSIIIYIFTKSGKINEAKEMFLVMLKENMQNINNIEKQISAKYLFINRKINLFRDVPKITYELAKIYSFIIKYSQLFHMNKYHNIFIDKYFHIQILNYKFFMIKGTVRGFSSETRSQLKFWLSYFFHNCSFYSINNYFPMKIPILFNYNILSLYNNYDENSLTDSEKSLLVKTSYNEGILYYINGQKDDALFNLNQAKEKIILFSDDYYGNNSFNNMNNNKKNFVNLFKKNVKENVGEINETKKIKKKSTINPFGIKFLEEKARAKKKKKTVKLLKSNNAINMTLNNNINDISLNSTDNSKKPSKDLSNIPKNKADELKSEIYKGFNKDKISISDIELLVKFGKEKGLLNEDKNVKEKSLDFLFKYKESFSAIKKKITLPKGCRGSHIDFHTTIKIKDFSIPERYKNPLFRKIEFLISIIELDKKNYESAYEHVLKVLYILFLLKLSSNNNFHFDFFNKQKIEINEYLQLIENTYEKDMKYKKLLEKSSSKSIITVNDRKSQSNIYNNLSNSMNTYNNNSFIIFENKDAENNFYLNFMNDNKDNANDNDLKNNNYNYNNKDSKIIKEFEKFFLFLNNLSLYQIKLLNETQPNDEKRNHLPIMISNQFKDCLTKEQRRELDNLQIMTLSRFMLLKDPNRWIIPTNLNYLLIERNRNSQINQLKTFHLNYNRYNFIDETFMKTKEYKKYLAIINSEKSTPEIKDFLKNNKNFVFKIIKESNDKEINNMINYPYIIIDPIKKYKRKIKKHKKSIININLNIDSQKRPKTITPDFARENIIKNKNSSSNNKYQNNNYKRNKSSTSKFYQMKKSANIKKRNDYNKYMYLNTVENKDSNKNINKEETIESFEEYLLSPELSSINDEDYINRQY